MYRCVFEDRYPDAETEATARTLRVACAAARELSRGNRAVIVERTEGNGGGEWIKDRAYVARRRRNLYTAPAPVEE